MKRLCSTLAFGMAAAFFASGAHATDFFVQPLTPGPVAGTALAVVTLQSTTGTTTDDSGGAKWLTTSGDTSTRWKRGGGRRIGGRGHRSTWTNTTSSGTSSGTTSGTTSGGTTTEGTTSGGTTSGGTTTEGTTSGGTTSGGTTSGGTTSGGTTSGGTTSGGTTSGGTTSGGTTSGGTSGGSTGQTWPSVDALLASGQVQGGDRIYLKDGYHGSLRIVDTSFNAPVVIAPAPGETAHLESISVRNSRNFVFQGLKVWAVTNNGGNTALVRSYPDSSDLAFLDLDIRGVATSPDYLTWSATDWANYKHDAMLIAGWNMTVARNRATGVFHGIFSLADNVLIEENIVDGFAGDGMRANGNQSIVRRNKVQNCVRIDANHPDGFQSFSRGTNGKVGTGTVKDLTIEENKFFEWVGTVQSPLRCKLQGIGMFDGMYDNVVIRNNIIVSRAYHGITINGALNTLIANNTVIHADGIASKWPWLLISRHKDGTPQHNVTLANNLVSNNKVKSDPALKVVETNNVIVKNPSTEFTSVANRDLTLKSTATGIDAGTPTFAPPTDIVGAPRPNGKAPDAGAYESF